MREKLIELLNGAESAVYWNSDDRNFIEKIADYLIANGVTVQKRGEWLKTNFGDVGRCSCCDKHSNISRFGKPKFCPECGADMRSDAPKDGD